jgi:hypothetical protein
MGLDDLEKFHLQRFAQGQHFQCSTTRFVQPTQAIFDDFHKAG